MYDDHLPAIALQVLFELRQGGDNTVDLRVPGVGHDVKFHRHTCSVALIPPG